MTLTVTQRLPPRLAENYRRLSGFSLYDQVLVDGTRRGTVAYIGETEFADGIWLGVCLRESNGRNNGTVQGKCYFRCPFNRGLFVRPSRVSWLFQPMYSDLDFLSICPSLFQILCFVEQSDRLKYRLVNRRFYSFLKNNRLRFPRKMCHLAICVNNGAFAQKAVSMHLEGWGDRVGVFEKTSYCVTGGGIRLTRLLERAHYDYVKAIVGDDAEELKGQGRGDHYYFRTNGFAHGLSMLFRMLCMTRYFDTLRIDIKPRTLLEEVYDVMLAASIDTLPKCKLLLLSGSTCSPDHPKVWRLTHVLRVEFLKFYHVMNGGHLIQRLFDYPIDRHNIQLTFSSALTSLQPVVELLKLWQSNERRIRSIELVDLTERARWTHEEFRMSINTLSFVDPEPEDDKSRFVRMIIRRKTDDSVLYLRMHGSCISINYKDRNFFVA